MSLICNQTGDVPKFAYVSDEGDLLCAGSSRKPLHNPESKDVDLSDNTEVTPNPGYVGVKTTYTSRMIPTLITLLQGELDRMVLENTRIKNDVAKCSAEISILRSRTRATIDNIDKLLH